jgi:hypothetical protein
LNMRQYSVWGLTGSVVTAHGYPGDVKASVAVVITLLIYEYFILQLSFEKVLSYNVLTYDASNHTTRFNSTLWKRMPCAPL